MDFEVRVLFIYNFFLEKVAVLSRKWINVTFKQEHFKYR